MGQAPLTDDQCREALAAFETHGNQYTAADALGIPRPTFQNRLRTAIKRGWGATKHRFLWTGHLHHHKSANIGGVKWEQLRAMTARDAYAYSHAFTARSQIQAITLHRQAGEVQRQSVSQYSEGIA